VERLCGSIAGVHLSSSPGIVYHVRVRNCDIEIGELFQNARPLFRSQIGPFQIVNLLLLTAHHLTDHNRICVSSRVNDGGNHEVQAPSGARIFMTIDSDKSCHVLTPLVSVGERTGIDPDAPVSTVPVIRPSNHIVPDRHRQIFVFNQVH